MNLEDSVYNQIVAICEQGNALSEAGDYHGALRLYHQSWNMLPEPKGDWEAATWILTAIGDSHYFLQDYENAIVALSNAVQCPDGLGNPFIHLRLGQASFELGRLDRAGDELMRAFLWEGEEIFKLEDPKYFAYLKSLMKPANESEDMS